MIQVHLSTQPLHPNLLKDYTGLPLSCGWTSEGVEKPSYRLIRDAKSFLFSVRVAGRARCQRHSFGSFVEGLWEEDVAELFLLDQEGQAYQEFNISPTGAWWTQTFSAPREAAPQNLKMPTKITPICQIRDDYWEAGFFLSFDELSVNNLLRDKHRANITAITGLAAREYFSVAALPGQKPDFHQPAAFDEVLTGFGGMA